MELQVDTEATVDKEETMITLRGHYNSVDKNTSLTRKNIDSFWGAEAVTYDNDSFWGAEAVKYNKTTEAIIDFDFQQSLQGVSPLLSN